MEIGKMLDRVIVIDNIKEELDPLADMLRSYDIAVDTHVVVDDNSSLPVYTRNRQLIFMDLMFDEDEGHLLTNISRVIQILNHIIGEGFGPFGLVLWTKHTNKMKEVLLRLDKAYEATDEKQPTVDEEEIEVDISLHNPPLFVIFIDKVQFKMTGKWDFSGLMSILNQEIQKSNASYFFLRWLSATRQASQDTISSIYSLTGSYEDKEKQIRHILYRLALNHTGISHPYPGLTADAYKAFNNILHPKINSLTVKEALPDFKGVENVYGDNEQVVLAQLNTILFIDNIGIEQSEIVPGNIYQIMKEDSPVLVKEEDRIEFKKKKDKWETYKDYNCIPIVIELTPPCDFSNKKVRSRVVGGYIVNHSAHEDKKKEISGSDKAYVLHPIYIPGDDSMKYIIFDFRHLYSPSEEELKDPNHYKILFRANHSLFSDVLQKFSSHAARLGLNALEMNKKIWL